MKKIIIISLMVLLLAMPKISYADVMSRLEDHWAAGLVDSKFILKYFPYFNNNETLFNPSDPIKTDNFKKSLTMLIKDYGNAEKKIEETNKDNIQEKTITRLKAARLIFNAYNNITSNDIKSTEENIFTDLHEFGENDINCVLKLHKLGIINGYPDGTFKPEKLISQIEGILLLQRLKESLELEITSIPFKVIKTSKSHSEISEGVSIRDLEEKISVTVTKKFFTSGYKLDIDKIERAKDNVYNIYLKIDKPKPNTLLLQVITYQSITIEIDKSYLQGKDYAFDIKILGLDVPIEKDEAEY